MTDITITANGTNNIYDLRGNDSTYSTARTTYTNNSDGELFRIGQAIIGGIYYFVNRGTPVFDLSSITNNVKAATIKLTGDTDYSTNDFNIQIRGYTESSLSADSTSYIAYGSTVFGTLNSSNYSASADGMSIALNTSGINYINNKLGSNCIFMLVSDDDMDADAVDGDGYVQLCSGEHTTSANRPHLELTYGTLWKPQIRFF